MNFMKTLTLSFLLFSNLAFSQMSQSDYIGTWNMTPWVSSHTLSRMVIKDNGSSLLISLKKEPFKTYHAKYDAVERKLRANVNGVHYYFIFQPASGKLFGFTENNNVKFADYQKN